MKRWLKTFLILAAIFLIPTLWLFFSHLLAKHALERYKAQLRAAGEKLTINELLPPRVLPERNGAKLLVDAFPYFSHEGILITNPPPSMHMVAPGKATIGWQQPAIVSDYEVPPITNTWKDIEKELKTHAPALELLHRAAAFPELDFGLDYHDTSMGGTTRLLKMKLASYLLSAAAISDLNRGDTASSVTNLHTLLVFVDEWKDERLMISQLVRTAMAGVATGPQWELLQATNLTDPELALLQHDWESMELIRSMENTLEMERVWDLAEIDELRTSNSPSAMMDLGALSPPGTTNSSGLLDFINEMGQSASRKTSDSLWRMCWSYGDELHGMQGLSVAIEAARQIETNGFFNNALAERDRRTSALGLDNRTNSWLRTHLDNNMLEFFDDAPRDAGRTIDRILTIEATRQIAITAIALKRYQLRHGNWPDNLSALVPEFLSILPRDPLDGQPLRYRRNPGGTFTLYSIGSDNQDNHGDPTSSARNLYWLAGRDWVWPQPATPEEIQQYYTNLQQRTSVYR